jgi:hypothetical protein
MEPFCSCGFHLGSLGAREFTEGEELFDDKDSSILYLGVGESF